MLSLLLSHNSLLQFFAIDLLEEKTLGTGSYWWFETIFIYTAMGFLCGIWYNMSRRNCYV